MTATSPARDAEPEPQPTTPTSSFEAQAARALDELAARDLARRCPRIENREGHRYRLDGHQVVGFCSNDYLGLGSDAASRPVDTQATKREGATASRLICGEEEVHREVETKIAALAGSEDAVLFPSAFQANLGVLPLVIGKGGRAFSDRLVHASLIDGLRLARAEVTILDHLAAPPLAPGNWWVTESIFSMDGDGPARAELDTHLEGGGFVYLDDAHAFGLGPGGAGRGRELARVPEITVLGLGKAIGRAGGAVAASRRVCAWIRSACRSFVFSTATAPAQLRAISEALDLVVSPEGDARRARLAAHARRVALALGRRSAGHIIPIPVGDNRKALAWSSAMLESGYHVQAIRPPTVPEGGARLRLTLSATHGDEEIDGMVDALARSARSLQLPWPPPPA